MNREQEPIHRRRFLQHAAATLGGGLLVLLSPPVYAKSALKKFKGKIIISKKRFPSRFKTDAKMIKHMKKVNTHEITATGDDDWEFEYMAFLRKPVAVLQAAVTYYDITVPGSQQFVDNFTFYPTNKSDQILNGHARLSKDKFSGDRKYLMIFARGYGQDALAQTKVVLRRKEGSKKKEEGDDEKS